jgi:hypothetical protein
LDTPPSGDTVTMLTERDRAPLGGVCNARDHGSSATVRRTISRRSSSRLALRLRATAPASHLLPAGRLCDENTTRGTCRSARVEDNDLVGNAVGALRCDTAPDEGHWDRNLGVPPLP